MIQHNGLTLAYLGDAIYELFVRRHLLNQGLTKVHDLHQQAILYTNSVSQAKAALKMVEDYYTEKEVSIFKRGRNQSASHKPKNTDVQTYNRSTGFEAVLGYLYLDGQKDRMNDVMTYTINYLNAPVDK